MNTQTEQLDDRPWYRQFWLWFLVFWPAAVVVAGVVMVTLATQTPVSLVETDYYKEGLRINENLAAADLAAELGVEAEVYFGDRYLRVDLNRPYSDSADSLRLTLIHPTDASADKAYALSPVGERRFESTLDTNEFAENDGADYRIRLYGESDQGDWALASGSESDRLRPDQWQSGQSGFRVVLKPNSYRVRND